MDTPVLSVTTQSTTSILVEWLSIVGTDVIIVLRSDSGGAFETIAYVPGDSTAYLDINLEPETEYCYKLIANDQCGTELSEAACDMTECLAPVTPGQPTAVQTGNTVTIEWTLQANTLSYKIERSLLDPESYSTLSTEVVGNVYVDNSVNLGECYLYRISANRCTATSAASVATTVCTECNIPTSVPWFIGTSSTSAGVVELSWGAVDSATSYTISRDAVEIATPSGTTYTDTGLEPGVSHDYCIYADNNCGQSSECTAVVAAPKPPVIVIPQDTDETEVDLESPEDGCPMHLCLSPEFSLTLGCGCDSSGCDTVFDSVLTKTASVTYEGSTCLDGKTVNYDLSRSGNTWTLTLDCAVSATPTIIWTGTKTGSTPVGGYVKSSGCLSRSVFAISVCEFEDAYLVVENLDGFDDQNGIFKLNSFGSTDTVIGCEGGWVLTRSGRGHAALWSASHPLVGVATVVTPPSGSEGGIDPWAGIPTVVFSSVPFTQIVPLQSVLGGYACDPDAGSAFVNATVAVDVAVEI